MSDPKRWLDDPAAPGRSVRLIAALRSPKAFTSTADDSIRARLAGTLANAPLAPAAAKFTALKIAVASGVIIGASVLVAYFVSGSRGERAAESVGRPVVVAVPASASSLPLADAPPVLEPAEASPTEERGRPSAPARPTTRGDSLAFEEALLEKARKASDASPSSALALLREHERRFPAGELSAERLFLMAKASASAGNHAAARRYARELERRFPKSAYLPEFRALLPAPSAAPPSSR